MSRICQVDPSCSSGRLGSHQHYLTQLGRSLSIRVHQMSYHECKSRRYEHFSKIFVSPQVQITKHSHFLFYQPKGDKGGTHLPVHPTHAIAGMLSNSKRTHTGCVSSVSCRSCPVHLEVIWKFDATCWELCSFWLIWLFDVRVLS